MACDRACAHDSWTCTRGITLMYTLSPLPPRSSTLVFGGPPLHPQSFACRFHHYFYPLKRHSLVFRFHFFSPYCSLPTNLVHIILFCTGVRFSCFMAAPTGTMFSFLRSFFSPQTPPGSLRTFFLFFFSTPSSRACPFSSSPRSQFLSRQHPAGTLLLSWHFYIFPTHLLSRRSRVLVFRSFWFFPRRTFFPFFFRALTWPRHYLRHRPIPETPWYGSLPPGLVTIPGLFCT